MLNLGSRQQNMSRTITIIADIALDFLPGHIFSQVNMFRCLNCNIYVISFKHLHINTIMYKKKFKCLATRLNLLYININVTVFL